jgi:hypothetical protein
VCRVNRHWWSAVQRRCQTVLVSIAENLGSV